MLSYFSCFSGFQFFFRVARLENNNNNNNSLRIATGNMATVQSNKISRIIIDTDCGVDDAVAILLAVLMKHNNNSRNGQNEVHIEAITTVCGNVDLSKVRPNVLRILGFCNAAKDIPVYEGATSPLIEPHRDASAFHGADGFGGVSHKYPPADVPLNDEHAANALIRLVRRYKGEISLITLGPLTNVALAQKLDPSFLENVKEVIAMGGNVTGSGNHTSGSEFNFGCDPEAMAILLNETKNPAKLLIVPFEVCRDQPLDWEYLASLDGNNKFVSLFNDIMRAGFDRWKSHSHPGAPIYDMITMAIFFDRSIVATSTVRPVSYIHTYTSISFKPK